MCIRDRRRQGPTIASRKGAIAIVIRSIGTDYHRNPHTGVMAFAEGVRPIPAGALPLPDAEQLQRILKRGKPVTMRLILASQTGRGQSGNVVAEVPGRDPRLPPSLVGAPWYRATHTEADSALAESDFDPSRTWASNSKLGKEREVEGRTPQ